MSIAAQWQRSHRTWTDKVQCRIRGFASAWLHACYSTSSGNPDLQTRTTWHLQGPAANRAVGWRLPHFRSVAGIWPALLMPVQPDKPPPPSTLSLARTPGLLPYCECKRSPLTLQALQLGQLGRQFPSRRVAAARDYLHEFQSWTTTLEAWSVSLEITTLSTNAARPKHSQKLKVAWLILA